EGRGVAQWGSTGEGSVGMPPSSSQVATSNTVCYVKLNREAPAGRGWLAQVWADSPAARAVERRPDRGVEGQFHPACAGGGVVVVGGDVAEAEGLVEGRGVEHGGAGVEAHGAVV